MNAQSSSKESLKTTLLVSTMVVALVSSIFLTRWLDGRRSPQARAEDETLYLNGQTARRMSLAFNGLAADWYWMRSLQYVGRKIINAPENVQIDNLGQLNLQLLAPLLDTATTLDPQFLNSYEYAAVVLPSIDVQQAIRITQKGIDANPTKWKLYHHLGYIYWQQKDFKAAGEAYDKGSKIPEAPAWMSVMKARMADGGGSRSTAREIYKHMYEQATDETVKEMARRRLLQLDSLDEREVLGRVLAAYRNSVGKCPANWTEVEPILRKLRFPLNSAGAPLDPSAVPYLLKECEIDLDSRSLVPRK
jgi:hypothetical protein